MIAPILPPLTGSEKQIAWATDIRADHLVRIEIEIAALERALATDLTEVNRTFDGYLLAERRIMLATASAETSAKWFIDNRDRLPQAGSAFADKLRNDDVLTLGDMATTRRFHADAIRMRIEDPERFAKRLARYSEKLANRGFADYGGIEASMAKAHIEIAAYVDQ